MSDLGNVHSNEVEAELDGVMRTLIAAAGRMGENIARMREEAARHAEAQSTQRARETQTQFEQERAMARAQLQPTREPAWWDRARPEDIAHAYETSAAWKDTDPDLAQAHAHMGDELRERYGINVNDVQAGPQRVAEVLNERATAIDAAAQPSPTKQERQETAQLLDAADQHDRAAEAARSAVVVSRSDLETEQSAASEFDGDDRAALDARVDREEKAGDQDRAGGLQAWDSGNRRDAHAHKMAEQGVEPLAIQAQYGADVSNAKHPRAAATGARGPARARRTTTKSTETQRERGGRGR